MADVFISYKRDERPAVEQIAASLRALRLTVWFDASMSAGETFSDEIDREVRGSKAVMVCWSPAAGTSQWVKAEALVGFQGDKLVAAQVAGPDGFEPPTPFNLVHAEDLRSWSTTPSDSHAGWRSVLRRIGKLSGRADIETWGALDAQASADDLRCWIATYSDSPLFTSVDLMLTAREAQDVERQRLDQEARRRRADEEAARKAKAAEAERSRLLAEQHRREAAERQQRHEEESYRQNKEQQRGSPPLAWVGGTLIIILAVASIALLNRQASGVDQNTELSAAEWPRPPSADRTGEPLQFRAPPYIVYLNESVEVPYEGRQVRLSLSSRALSSTNEAGAVVDYALTGLPDPESCSFTPTRTRILAICRDIDWGPMFLTFLNPESGGTLSNALNPVGRGFHLPAACAPPRDYQAANYSEEQQRCYAPVRDRLLLVAFNGEVGSNLIAVNTTDARVEWPRRASDVSGIGVINTLAQRHAQFEYFQIENTYRASFAPSVAYTLSSQPNAYAETGSGLEVYGIVQFDCENPWETDPACTALPSNRRSFRTDITWYFSR